MEADETGSARPAVGAREREAPVLGDEALTTDVEEEGGGVM